MSAPAASVPDVPVSNLEVPHVPAATAGIAPVPTDPIPPVATPSIPPAASPPAAPPAMPASGTEAALSSPEHICKCGKKHPKTPDFMSADLIRLGHCVLDPSLRAALTRHTEGKSRADLDDRCDDEDFFISVERLFNSGKVFENPFVGDDDFGGTLNQIGATVRPVPHDRFSGTLKTKWQEVRSQVTVGHSNYERSGQNTSDRLKFVGNAAQLYVWKLLDLTKMFGAATRAVETDLQGERGLRASGTQAAAGKKKQAPRKRKSVNAAAVAEQVLSELHAPVASS
ncbi:hypothetical protein CYMTET_8926 [Cymbomonas tetramitiformis]|uniref:Uncharacterized protein n=1 Tax=Cymbomonas tetramitiformis TaxID=36881 RepID=A0AAE0GSC1_9CHLO|nr:hypothetical protein CYMTET_8926 [Cymbomonas tetramitiformis]